jgi:hypothetical protein
VGLLNYLFIYLFQKHPFYGLQPFCFGYHMAKVHKKEKGKKKLELIFVFLSPKRTRNKTLVSSTSIYHSSSLMGILG